MSDQNNPQNDTNKDYNPYASDSSSAKDNPFLDEKATKARPSASRPAAKPPRQAPKTKGSDKVPGKGQATASMVFGILAVICWFFGWSSLASIVFGIIGLGLASQSKKAGYDEGMRTAGFVLSLIGLIGGGIAFIACVACVGSIASLAG